MPFLSPNNSVKALKGYQHTVLNPAREDQPPASSFPHPPTEGRHIKHIHKKHLVKDEKRSVTYQL